MPPLLTSFEDVGADSFIGELTIDIQDVDVSGLEIWHSQLDITKAISFILDAVCNWSFDIFCFSRQIPNNTKLVHIDIFFLCLFFIILLCIWICVFKFIGISIVLFILEEHND